jgi:hypothetical protein
MGDVILVQFKPSSSALLKFEFCAFILSKQQMENSRIALFHSKEEFAGLILPAVASVLLGVWYIFGNSEAPRPGSLIYFLPAVLGNGHSCFTFLLLASLPEGRRITRSVLLQGWGKVALVSGFAAALLAYFVFLKDSDSDAVKVVQAMLVLLFSQHALGQMRGLSLLYNRRLKDTIALSEAETVRFNKLERLERKLHFGLLIAWLLVAGAQGHWPRVALYILTALLFLLVCAILAVSLLYPYARRSNKTFFLLRLFIFPLAAVVPAAGLIAFVVHGFEYNQFVLGIYRGSKTKLRPFAWAGTFTVLLVVFPLMHFLPDYFNQPGHPLLATFAVAANAVDYLHYYIDSVIFRFNDPRVRQAFASVSRSSM